MEVRLWSSVIKINGFFFFFGGNNESVFDQKGLKVRKEVVLKEKEIGKSLPIKITRQCNPS